VAYCRRGVPGVLPPTNTSKHGNSQYSHIGSPYTKYGPLATLEQRTRKMRNGFITLVGEPDGNSRSGWVSYATKNNSINDLRYRRASQITSLIYRDSLGGATSCRVRGLALCCAVLCILQLFPLQHISTSLRHHQLYYVRNCCTVLSFSSLF
jgi:hypothetical protein